MTPGFVFCHGWGMRPAYWEPLIAALKPAVFHSVDLGYYGEPRWPSLENARPWIAVGHSVGMLKLLEWKHGWHKVVGLQSFTCFLGHTPALRRQREQELSGLAGLLTLSPGMVLKQFHATCGLEPQNMTGLNTARLRDDLASLSADRTALMPKCPVLVLGAEDDVIVPPALIHDNFAAAPGVKSVLTPRGRHALGHVEPEWCKTQIESLLATP